MRWFVEVSRVGENGVADEYCVEAKQWQAALQEARKLRGDTGALSKFSIELLDRGYRAVDPSLKLRYLINEAPPDAPLTGAGGSSKKNGSKADASGKHRASESLAPSAYATSLAPTPFTTSLAPPAASNPVPRPTSHGAPRPNSVAPPRAASVEPPPVQQLLVPDDPVPRAPALPSRLSLPPLSGPRVPPFELVRQRAEEPRPDSPITYREFAYAVEPGRTWHRQAIADSRKRCRRLELVIVPDAAPESRQVRRRPAPHRRVIRESEAVFLLEPLPIEPQLRNRVTWSHLRSDE